MPGHRSVLTQLGGRRRSSIRVAGALATGSPPSGSLVVINLQTRRKK